MAQLGILQNGVTVTPPRVNPLNLGQTPPEALPPNTAALSKAQAHSALMGTVASTLAQLPQTIVGSFLKGREISQQAEGDQLLKDLASGKTTLPAGMSAGAHGALSYKAPGANADLERQEKQADIDLTKARLTALQSKAPATDSNPLAAAFNANGGSDSSPSDDGESIGIPLGTGTSYGYKGDTFGGPNALASTKGATGTSLDEASMAVSPDIEEMLKSKGHKLGDMVTLKADDGETYTRRWDDRTAQYDATGKWSVDDSGRFISKTDGKPYRDLPEDQRLPALTGRFDFHADAKGKPSSLNGKKIVGILNPNQDGGALAPSGTAPALAPLDTTGGEEMFAPAATGALSATPAQAAPVQSSAIVRPDGTIDAEAATKAPSGLKVSDEGHHGGPVYKQPGMYIEHGSDGGVYGYPEKTKGGAVTQIVIKKPTAQGPIPAQIRTEAIRMGVPVTGKTAEEVSKGIEDKQIETGVIPPHLLPVAQSLAHAVVSHPALKHIPTIREAKEAVDAGIANPNAGGFGDMAIVEGFQRMVNPGATVRQGTMDNMLKAAGMGQYSDLGFLMDHFKQGDKFSPEVRQKLKVLSEDIYQRVMKNAEPQMKGMKHVARSYGITNPDAFVDNVLTIAPMFTGEGTPVDVAGKVAQPTGATAMDPKASEAIEWLKANPNDPKAAGVRASLQARGIKIQ